MTHVAGTAVAGPSVIAPEHGAPRKWEAVRAGLGARVEDVPVVVVLVELDGALGVYQALAELDLDVDRPSDAGIGVVCREGERDRFGALRGGRRRRLSGRLNPLDRPGVRLRQQLLGMRVTDGRHIHPRGW